MFSLAYLPGVEIADIPAVAGDHQLHGKDEKEDDGSLVTVSSPYQSRAEGRHGSRDQGAGQD